MLYCIFYSIHFETQGSFHRCSTVVTEAAYPVTGELDKEEEPLAYKGSGQKSGYHALYRC